MNNEPIDLRAQRAQFLPKDINREADSLTINGGIGDGVNDGGPAYCIDTDNDGDDEI